VRGSTKRELGKMTRGFRGKRKRGVASTEREEIGRGIDGMGGRRGVAWGEGGDLAGNHCDRK